MNNKKVLLTGVTGFLGSHTTIQLLEKGYEVIGTLRDMKRAGAILKIIEKHTSITENLHFAEADLRDKDIWKSLTKDIDYVQHIASPFPRKLPKNDDELVKPAKEGVLNILNAASKNKVKRVVITSSIASVVYGKAKGNRNKTFNESDWTDETNKNDTTPYFRSKVIAEKAAWDFIKNDNSGLELATVMPGAILGPVLENDFGTSANIVIKLLDGSSPAIPDLYFDIVDVRSVADLLIKAMETPKAKDNRFLATTEMLSMKQIAAILKEEFPDKKIPKREIPDFMVRLFSNFDTTLKPVIVDLGYQRRTDNTKSKTELGWQPISAKEAILACAKSIYENKIIQ